MPKLKTHKQLAKVLNKRPGGTITHGHSSARHNTGKKNMDINRKNRKKTILSESYRKKFKGVI